jgi:hypothetical protein
MTLALTAALNPTTISPGQTSVLTVTRSGGGVSSGPVVYSENFNSYGNGTATSVAGWTRTMSGYFHAEPNISQNQIRAALGDNDDDAGSYTLSRTFVGLSGIFSCYAVLSNLNAWLQVLVSGSVVSQIQITATGTYTITVPPGATVRFNVSTYGVSTGSLYLDNFTLTESVNTATDALTITLSSSVTGVATVPASVVIPQNQLSATVNVTGVAAGTSDITSVYGSVSDVETITVSSPPIIRLSNLDSEVVGLTTEPNELKLSNLDSEVVGLITEPKQVNLSYFDMELLGFTSQPKEIRLSAFDIEVLGSTSGTIISLSSSPWWNITIT